jgi:rod shape-determining protein MreC
LYDKQVRRRRGVLLALVLLSLILLTAYFGEAPSGGLHAVQRGFLTVLSPIESGANKALKPVRDLFGWVGDTIHARSQRDAYRKQVELLRKEVVQNQGAERTAAELQRLLGLDTSLSLSRYSPVTAHVIERSPTLFSSTVGLDAGSNRGVHINDPVVNADGLVGKVSLVTPDASVVQLITDQSSGVSAMINATGASGIIQPAVGDPTTLVLSDLPTNAHIHVGQDIVTTGTIAGRLDDLFPPEIPIGKVTSLDGGDNLYQSVHVRPFANLRQLDVVQVLTHGTQGARAINAVAQLKAQPTGPQSAPGTQTAQVGVTGG